MNSFILSPKLSFFESCQQGEEGWEHFSHCLCWCSPAFLSEEPQSHSSVPKGDGADMSVKLWA